MTPYRVIQQDRGQDPGEDQNQSHNLSQGQCYEVQDE